MRKRRRQDKNLTWETLKVKKDRFEGRFHKFETINVPNCLHIGNVFVGSQIASRYKGRASASFHMIIIEETQSCIPSGIDHPQSEALGEAAS